uniref:Shisa N-terminal domain-containing protein n=1 Tax=Pseudonaja textilis TaxID=8673 RepID=A0A670YVP7_PSETE
MLTWGQGHWAREREREREREKGDEGYCSLCWQPGSARAWLLSVVLRLAGDRREGIPSPNWLVSEQLRSGVAKPRRPYETCMGYYDVSGQWDKEFECNNTQQDFRYCCGTCSFRFCCNKRSKKLNQDKCRNQDPRPSTDPMTPATKNDGPGDIPNGYDPNEDNTNATVYISCGAIAFVVIAGIFAKVAYDKARQPPQEMNIHRNPLSHRNTVAFPKLAYDSKRHFTVL